MTGGSGTTKDGVTQIYVGTDLKYEKTVSEADNKTNLSKGFTAVIQLASNLGADDATGIIGHEAFVHVEPGLNRIKQINLKPGTKEYAAAVKQVLDKDGDHSQFAMGKVTKYKQFSESMDKKRGTDKFIKKYETDVKEHEHYIKKTKKDAKAHKN